MIAAPKALAKPVSLQGAAPWLVGLLRSRGKPYVFVTEVLGVLPSGIENPGRLPQLEEWQTDALHAIGRGERRISIRSGHGVGKGAFFAWLTLWALLTYKEVKVPIAANTQDQLKYNNWAEINKWHQRLPQEIRDQIVCEAEKVFKKVDPQGAFAMARTANKSTPEALAGIHSEMVIFLVDEASGIPEIVFETALGALSGENAIQILASNPTRRSGYFFDTHNKLKDRFYCIKVNCEDVPRARGHIEDVIRTYGKDSNKYLVRVKGEFPTKDDDVVIPYSLIQAAVYREVFGYNVFPTWGLDVGRKGNDPSALAKRRGNHLLEKIKEWKNLEGDVLAKIIEAEFFATEPELRPAHICIDVIGVGASVYDHLKNVSLPRCKVHGINVAESASALDVAGKRCHRLRDELWWRGRMWFEAKDCFIPEDPELVAELSNPTYDHTAAGRIIVESKGDMKTRTGMPSPNRADAFLLTFSIRDEAREGLVDRHRRRRDRDQTTAMAA